MFVSKSEHEETKRQIECLSNHIREIYFIKEDLENEKRNIESDIYRNVVFRVRSEIEMLYSEIEKLENIVQQLIEPKVNVNASGNKVSNKTKFEVEISDHPGIVDKDKINDLIIDAIKNELKGSDE
ncbi:MAG: hypothetical protein ACOCZ5_01895 [bacterium]